MHEGAQSFEVESAPTRTAELVPQVVYADEPVTVFSASGAPQMSSRRVPYTRWVAFSPADYARYLRRWSAANMPVESRAANARGAAVVFGLVLIVAALGMAASGLESQSVGLLVGALLCGSVGCAVIGETGESARNRKLPGGAFTQSAAWSRGEAYVAMEQGHFGRAAALNDHAMWAQGIADQEREAARRSAERAGRTDEQYWTDLAGWTVGQQWQAADAFRESIAREWARRVGGQAVIDVSVIPSYDDVVAWLRWTPSAW